MLALVILAGSCANRVVPQGGPVDEDPPVLISSTPENMAVNFNEDKVVFRFDEYVRLENQDQIFISPPLSESPRYRANGKEVIVELPDELSDDITYTISFGNSIVDNNEGNAYQDFKYVFSTGKTLDSLILEGIVFRAEDLEPEKDAIVVLYPDTIPDSSVFRIMPTYYSRLDEQGAFTVFNIREGSYRLFAIEDVNKNFLAEIPSERIAFHDTLLLIPAADPVTMYSFKQQPAEVKVLNSKSTALGVSVVIFNGPAPDPEAELLYNELLYSDLSSYGDSLWLYHSIESDSTGIILNMENMIDTVWTFRKNTSENAVGELQITGYSRNGNDSVFIQFNMPFKKTVSGGVYLDSAEVEYVLNEKGEGVAGSFTIQRPDSSRSLFISKGTFVDIYDNSCDSMRTQIMIPDERQTGIVELEVSPPDHDAVYVVFTDASWNRFDKIRVSQPGTFEITGLMPGGYIVSAFLDEDDDGDWTPGDFYSSRQPEKVIVNRDQISVRANWTIQIKWEIDN